MELELVKPSSPPQQGDELRYFYLPSRSAWYFSSEV